MFKPTLFSAAFAAVTALAVFSNPVVAAESLKLQVYNPGEQSLFPVSSELVTGATEAVLIDAQFQSNDAQALVAMIKASGKRLTSIYISHSDPDSYFGLDVLQAAFPQAKIVATAPTIAAIKANKDAKLAYWGPILKANAPKKLLVPELLQGNQLSVDGQPLEVQGLHGAASEHSYVWIPSLKAVVGGVLVYGNMHLWTADAQTPLARVDWQQSLQQIQALKPQTVVPGHYLAGASMTLSSVSFTADYLKVLETELPKARNSGELVKAMVKQYPQLTGTADLELSAKVLKGEMQWPQ
ncbi:MAG: MBL fold metallo-hydrolase [Pseudomonadaceae bacterium]|nr:MBL fold metallo-hydrolase [Pseudomonadaceae bacterium]